MDIYMPEDPQEKPFPVLSFSRQALRTLGFPSEQISRLTDEDIEHIAVSLAQTYPDFLERLQLNVRLYLAKEWSKQFVDFSINRLDLQHQLGFPHELIAAGAWSARFGNWLGFSLLVSPMRGQILSLRQPASPLKHILFGEGVYLVPKLDGTIYVGATVEQVGFDKAVTAEGIAWLLSSAIQLVPSLASAPITNIWAGLRPWSPDSRPSLVRLLVGRM